MILFSKFVLINFLGMAISVVGCKFATDSMDFVELEHVEEKCSRPHRVGSFGGG
jgi:hypothetical protein